MPNDSDFHNSINCAGALDADQRNRIACCWRVIPETLKRTSAFEPWRKRPTGLRLPRLISNCEARENSLALGSGAYRHFVSLTCCAIRKFWNGPGTKLYPSLNIRNHAKNLKRT